MQISRFGTGGYVLHKCKIGKSKYSVWFDRDGKMVDVQRTFPVVASVPDGHAKLRAELSRVGARYRPS